MRTLSRNAAVFAVFLMIPLSGCSASTDKPSAGMTEITLDCAKYPDTAKKITDAQTELYQRSGGSAAVDSLLNEFDGLRKGAPADVRAALTELGAAFRKAEQVMAHPTADNAAELRDLGPKLSEDSRKVNAYVVSRCH
jgi:hypothetical protein